MKILKKNKEKFKQLFLSFLAFFLIGLGYFNWNLDQKSNNLELSSNSNDINIGDVELVNSEPVKEFENSIVTNTAIVSNEDLKSNIVEVSATKNNALVNIYAIFDGDKKGMMAKMIPGITRYLGIGSEIATMAIKYGLDQVYWLGASLPL